MKTESLQNGLTLPKIGFGTWKIGGGMSPDRSQDDRSLAALACALEVGYTHFDTAEMYAGGYSEELLARAIKENGVAREDIVITTKVHPSNLRYNDILSACNRSLDRLQTEYIDLYLIHWPGSTPLEDTFRGLNLLHQEGKVRHLGVSNFDLIRLKLAREICSSPIVTNQVPYSITDRAYERNGMLAYCQENDIFLTAYSPVEEGNLRTRGALTTVGEKYGVSPYTVALAWLVRQARVITIPMSMNPDHIRSNFSAADLELDAEDLALLD